MRWQNGAENFIYIIKLLLTIDKHIDTHFKVKMQRYVTTDRSVMKHHSFAFGTGSEQLFRFVTFSLSPCFTNHCGITHQTFEYPALSSSCIYVLFIYILYVCLPYSSVKR
jgi:hypothetical protein